MNFITKYIKAVAPSKYYSWLIWVQKEIKSIPYIGFAYICPCCGGHFRKFLSYGDPPRLNAQCPRCESLERHRILWMFLKSKTNLFTDKFKVLHLAPEYYFQRVFKSMPNLDYRSADIVSTMAMEKFDISNIPYEDNSFDVIICIAVLEFVKNDITAMGELFRVLKPGGWAILNSLISYDLEETLEFELCEEKPNKNSPIRKDGLARIYGIDYKNKLEKAGFNVEVNNYFKELSEVIVKKNSLSQLDKIYVCRK